MELTSLLGDVPGLAGVRGCAGPQLVLGHHAEVVLAPREDPYEGVAVGVHVVGHQEPGAVCHRACEHSVVQRDALGLVR